jgi:hypothetical protein
VAVGGLVGFVVDLFSSVANSSKPANGANRRAVAPGRGSAPRQEATALDAMAQLGRDGARRQLLLVLRDCALLAIPVIALIYVVPVAGFVALGLVVFLAMVFAVLLLTSPARLRKVINDQASMRAMIVLRRGRRSMGRVWMISAPNRSLVMALKADDVDAFLSAHAISSSRVRPAIFESESQARAAYATAMGQAAKS